MERNDLSFKVSTLDQLERFWHPLHTSQANRKRYQSYPCKTSCFLPQILYGLSHQSMLQCQAGWSISTRAQNCFINLSEHLTYPFLGNQLSKYQSFSRDYLYSSSRLRLLQSFKNYSGCMIQFIPMTNIADLSLYYYQGRHWHYLECFDWQVSTPIYL